LFFDLEQEEEREYEYQHRYGKANCTRAFAKPQSAPRPGTKIKSQGEATATNAGPADQEKSHGCASPG